MIRFLYRCLLAMHPAAFRNSFAGEMLDIFDDCEGGTVLLADGLASLGRQWLFRNQPWRILLTAAGALLELSAVVLLFWRAGR